MTDNDKSPDRHGFWLYLAIASAGALCLSLYFLAKSKTFAFFDVGVDTFFCFYPLQLAVARQLHELHSLTWSFELGLGGFLGSLFDPLWLVTGWLPVSWQLSMRLPMFLLRLLLGGGFFYGYLRQVGFRPPLAVIGGLGYAFSSYGMINAQWEVMHGTEFVQFPAFLYLLEKYLRGGPAWSAVVAGAVIGIGHPMGLYMFGLFGFLYACIRLPMTSDGARIALLKGLFHFVAWGTLGLLTTAPLLFPALYYLFESPRVTGDHSLLPKLLAQIFSINDLSVITTEIAGLLGKDLLGTGSHFKGWGNYLEAPGFYIGLLPLLCVPQLLGPSATRRERRICIIGSAIILAYFIFPALRDVVYGFGESAFRFSTLWISIMILTMGLAGLQRVLTSGLWIAGIAMAVAGVFGIVGAAILFIPEFVEFHQIFRVVAFTGVYAVYLIALRDANFSTRAIFPLIAIFSCELFMFAISPIVNRDAVAHDASSPIGSYHDGTEQALTYIRQYDNQINPEGGFFRIDKTYNSVFLDDALVQDYSGTASYFFHAASITRFVDKLNLARVTPSANYISSMVSRREIADLVGIKYVLSRDRNPDAWRDFSYLNAAGGINIYRNNTVRPFANFYESVLAESDADRLPVPQREALLLEDLVVVDPAALKLRMASARTSVPPQPNLTRNAHLDKLRDDELSGTVATPTASALLLAMPFDIGWHAALDGKKLELFRADYGLTAAVVPAGRYSLVLNYSPPGQMLGLVASSATLSVLLVLWLKGRLAKIRPRREG